VPGVTSAASPSRQAAPTQTTTPLSGSRSRCSASSISDWYQRLRVRREPASQTAAELVSIAVIVSKNHQRQKACPLVSRSFATGSGDTLCAAASRPGTSADVSPMKRNHGMP
jgi:hypothetical protein